MLQIHKIFVHFNHLTTEPVTNIRKYNVTLKTTHCDGSVTEETYTHQWNAASVR